MWTLSGSTLTGSGAEGGALRRSSGHVPSTPLERSCLGVFFARLAKPSRAAGLFAFVLELHQRSRGRKIKKKKMITAEPLRSALTNSGAEDTSLALPSDDKLRSGKQRVLDQVLTIKRSKSKHGKNGTLPTRTVSPTSRKSHTHVQNHHAFLFIYFVLFFNV